MQKPVKNNIAVNVEELQDKNRLDAEMALFEQELLNDDLGRKAVKEDVNLDEQIAKEADNQYDPDEEAKLDHQRTLFQELSKRKKMFSKMEQLKEKRSALQSSRSVKKKVVEPKRALIKCFQDEFSD
jgi:hypothetical protein